MVTDFPEQQKVPPGTVRVGTWEGHPYFQCEHMDDIAVLQNNEWSVITHNPLTVQPSILNVECGCHGYITNGIWVRA